MGKPRPPKEGEKTATGRTKLKPRVSSKVGVKGLERDGRWWAGATEKSRGEALWETVETLDKYNGVRHMTDALYVGTYEGELPYWAAGMSTGQQLAPVFSDVSGNKATLNVIKSAVDTAAALLSKNLAEIRVLTSGGTWRQQRRAKLLTKYLAGSFDNMQYHVHQQRAFIDGCLTRKGAVKFWADKTQGKICCERIAPHTLLWNDLEGDAPRSLYQRAARSRQMLTASFPEHEELIAKAPASVNPVNPAYRRTSGLSQHADMVDVVEGWHLPSKKRGVNEKGEEQASDGLRVLMIEGTVLVEEEWQHPFFPFAEYCWDDAYEGFGGRPMAKILMGYQIRIGRMMRVIQRAQDLACVPRVWTEQTAAVPGDHITNEIGGVGKFVGQPPVIAPGRAMDPEYYDFLWKLKEEAFAEVGLSLLQSRGEKPSGLDSEPSLREYNDITNTRQVVKGQRLERQTESAASIVIALSRELYEDNPKLRVLAPGTKFLQEISWSEVDMEEDTFTLRSFAVSSLPTHAVGRIQTVTELIKAGIVPQDEAAGLLGFPDLEKVQNLQTANKELALMQCDAALYEGEYIGPEPYQDLDLLVGLANKEYLFARQLKDVPKKNMEFLRRLMAEGDAMRKRLPGGAGASIPVQDPAMLAATQPLGAPGAAIPGALPAAQMAPNIPGSLPLPSPALPTVAPAGIVG